jgi:hypothetical protein
VTKTDTPFTFDDLDEIVHAHQRDLLHRGPDDALPARLALTIDGHPIDPAVITRWRRGPFGQLLRRIDTDAFARVLDDGAVLRVRDVHEIHRGLDVDDPLQRGSRPRVDAVARWRRGTRIEITPARRMHVMQISGRQVIEHAGATIELTPGCSVALAAGTTAVADGPTGSDASLHLEITSTFPTVRDLLFAIRPALIGHEVARNALPAVDVLEANPSRLERLAETLRDLVTPAAVDDVLRSWRADTASGRRPNIPWSATASMLPPTGGWITFGPRPNGTTIDESTLRHWFPALGGHDLALLAGAGSGPVEIERVLARSTDPVRLRNAIAELVLGGVLELYDHTPAR